MKHMETAYMAVKNSTDDREIERHLTGLKAAMRGLKGVPTCALDKCAKHIGAALEAQLAHYATKLEEIK
jgi:hypothetical protein